MMTYRNHPISIIYFKVKIFSLIQFAIFLFLSIEVAVEELSPKIDNKIIIGMLVIIFSIIVILLFRTLVWYKTTYTLSDNSIVWNKQTFLYVKNNAIKREFIASIHSTKPLFLRMTNIAVVSITTSTGVGDKHNSIDLVLSQERFQEIENYFYTDIIENGEKIANIVSYKYNLIQAIEFFIIDQFFVNFLAIVYIFVDIFLEKDLNYSWVVAILIPSFITGMKTFLKTANLATDFDVSAQKVKISYGVANKIEFNFNIDDIKVVRVEHYKLINKYNVEVEIVGLDSFDNDVKTASMIITLLCNKKRVNEVLEMIGYKYDDYTVCNQSRIKVIPHVISYFFILLLAFVIINVLKFFSLFNFYAISIIIFVLSVLLILHVFEIVAVLKSNKFMYNNYILRVDTGFFKKESRIVKFHNIEDTNMYENIINKKTNTKSLSINNFSVTVLPSVLLMKYFKKDDIEKLNNFIDNKFSKKSDIE